MQRQYTPTSIIVTTITLGAALAGLASCGDDIDISVKRDNYCQEVSKVLCRNMFTCCTGAAIEETLGIVITTDEGECRRDIALLCEERNYAVLDGVARDTVAVDEALATGCLTALKVEGERCFLNRARPPWFDACRTLWFAGKQSPDQACFSSIECQKDSACGADQKCHALPKEDEPCPDNTCASGLRCTVKIDSTSFQRICRPLAGEGEDCSLPGTSCRDGLFCAPGDSSSGKTESGKCRALKAKGESCSGSSECATAFCVPGVCGDGSACQIDSQCAGQCSKSGERCTNASTCGGQCSVSKIPCTSRYSCPSSAEECEFDECVHECGGERVCGEKPRKVDFCEDPTKMLLPTSSSSASSSGGTSGP